MEGDSKSRRHFRAVVEYDGADFHGFQVQVAQRTVQGVLEEAVECVSRQSVRVVGAGRTDAGVHARGQVIAFWANWRRSAVDLHRALNAVLPKDVALSSLEVASEAFHPRYDAKRRWYRYTVLNQPLRSPLDRRQALHVHRRLDVAAMNRAAVALLGERDFATFGRPPKGKNTVRRVMRAEWHRREPFVLFEIEANAFLHRMVRSLVGTLLQVGFGGIVPEEFARRLGACDRTLAGPTAPPHGLCLMAVSY